MDEESLKILAEQLANPSGEKGIEVAEMMGKTNISMTIHSIANLEIKDGESVLEIGHGNCGHLKFIFEKASNIQYTGYDTSELMNTEAKRVNEDLMKNHLVEFKLYDGQMFPESDNQFHKIFTVNTVYFWKKPECFLQEIYRIIKPGGFFCLTFAEKEFMQMLPFTQFGFTLYNSEDIQKLTKNSGFKLLRLESQNENIQSKTGEIINRKFITAVLVKSL